MSEEKTEKEKVKLCPFNQGFRCEDCKLYYGGKKKECVFIHIANRMPL